MIVPRRVSEAVLTVPGMAAWLDAGILLLLFAMMALPIGLRFRFVKVEIVQASWQTIITLLVTSFVLPAITEELFFRVLLLPRPSDIQSSLHGWFWGGLSLGLFIIYHPLNAITFFPRGRETFFNPVFLTLAGLLGIVCTLSYLDSGSLWIPVILHWVIVVFWLLGLGGYKKLYG